MYVCNVHGSNDECGALLAGEWEKVELTDLSIFYHLALVACCVAEIAGMALAVVRLSHGGLRQRFFAWHTNFEAGDRLVPEVALPHGALERVISACQAVRISMGT